MSAWGGDGKEGWLLFRQERRKQVVDFTGQRLVQVGGGGPPTVLQRKSPAGPAPRGLQGRRPHSAAHSPVFPLAGRCEPPLQRPWDLLTGYLQLPLRAGLGGRRLRGARLPWRMQWPWALRGRPLPVCRALRGGRLRPPRLPQELQRAGRVRARRVPVLRGLHVGGLQRAALPRRLQRPRLLRHGRVLLRGGLLRPGLLAGCEPSPPRALPFPACATSRHCLIVSPPGPRRGGLLALARRPKGLLNHS